MIRLTLASGEVELSPRECGVSRRDPPARRARPGRIHVRKERRNELVLRRAAGDLAVSRNWPDAMLERRE